MSTIQFIEVGSERGSDSVTINGDLSEIVLVRDGVTSTLTCTAFSQNGFIYLVSGKVLQSFGTLNDQEVNYCYLMLVFKQASDNSMTFDYGSKYVYGWNCENSFIDLSHNYVLDTEVVVSLSANFEKAFGAHIKLQDFLRLLSETFNDPALIKQHIASITGDIAILSQKLPADIPAFAKPNNVLIVHHDDRELGAANVLVHTVMEKSGHLVYFANVKSAEKIDVAQFEHVDIAIILSSSNTALDYAYIPTKALVVLNFGFYSCGIKLIKQLPSLVESTKDCPDRKEELAKLMKTMNTGDQKEGGCCGGGGCGSGGCGSGGCEDSSKCTPNGCDSASCCKTKKDDVKDCGPKGCGQCGPGGCGSELVSDASSSVTQSVAQRVTIDVI